MLLFEIFESERELAEFLTDEERFRGKTSLITADNREILDKLLGKSKEWYRIEYRGKRKNLTKYLLMLKVECIKDYFITVSLPESGTITDLRSVVLEICESQNRMKNQPALSCNNDPTLSDDEVEVSIIVPAFDLNWQLDSIWKK